MTNEALQELILIVKSLKPIHGDWEIVNQDSYRKLLEFMRGLNG